MKYLLITIDAREGERVHTHRCLHTTTGNNIQFAAQRYISTYWGWGEREDDWWWFHGEITLQLRMVKELSEYEYRLMSELFSETIVHSKNYFEIVHAGWCEESQREEIQIHAGEHGNVFLFQDDGKLGFIVDAYGQTDHVATMQVWEEDLAPEEDDEGNCPYCGQKCWEGEMCDEQQAGGFNGIPDEPSDPENFSMSEIEDFIDEWGQTQDEICEELGYDDDGADEMIIGDGYVWLDKYQKWFPKCSSMYDAREQAIIDFLRL